jgi:hypothetical protein
MEDHCINVFLMNSFAPFGFHLDYKNEPHEIIAIPQIAPLKDELPISFYVIINGSPMGNVTATIDTWTSDGISDQILVDIIGDRINARYT